MQEYNKIFERAIQNKVIKPLTIANEKNIAKIKNKKHIYKIETVNLLAQSYSTLKNVKILMKSKDLVDASTLLRSSLENMMMGMVIHFNEDVYDEFKISLKIGKKRKETAPSAIRKEFGNYLPIISDVLFEETEIEDINLSLDELYQKLCNFTHSSLIISLMQELENSKEKEVLMLISYFNVYVVEIMLFCSLKYLTNDKVHYIDFMNLFFSMCISMGKINKIINENHLELKKYKKFLYYDDNIAYFEKENEGINKMQPELKDFQSELDKKKEFIEEAFLEFIS